MARADRRAVRRARARVLRRPRGGQKASVRPVEDTLFFSRIRNHAKWVFVFLAITFASSFVLFGVGTGFGGLQDILLQNNGVAGGPSESDARDRIAENPKDAQAYRDLATALQNQQKPEESIAPLAKYVELEPSDTDSPASSRRSTSSRPTSTAPRPSSPSSASRPTCRAQSSSRPRPRRSATPCPADPINDALSSRHNTALNAAITKMTEASRTPSRPTSWSPRPSRTTRRSSSSSPRRPRRQTTCRPRSPPTSASSSWRPRISRPPRSRNGSRCSKNAWPRPGEVDSARPGGAANTGDSMNFEIKTEELGDDAYVISLAGEVDLYTAPEFKQQLLDVISQGGKNVIVDFSNTTFIDSTTLGVLVGSVKRLRTNDGQLSLVCSDRNITKIFEITGLDRVFTIYRTRDEAVRADQHCVARPRCLSFGAGALLLVPAGRLRHRRARGGASGRTARSSSRRSARLPRAEGRRRARAAIGPSLDAAFAAPREEGFDESTIPRGRARPDALPGPADAAARGALPLRRGQRRRAGAYDGGVAAYRRLGRPTEQAIAQAGRGARNASADDPKALFTSNCAGCHTFSGRRARAGRSAQARPEPSTDRIAEQIRTAAAACRPSRAS